MDVKDNYYFAMGTQRFERRLQILRVHPERNIFGRILFRYFPFQRFAFNVNESAESVVKERFMN